MYGVILLLVVAMLSLLITRIATIALTATGMPQPSARFQARSALTGVRRADRSPDGRHWGPGPP